MRKNLDHWKEPEEIKVPKQFSVSLKTAIETSEAIFTSGVKQKNSNAVSKSVPITVRISIRTYFHDRQASEEDRIGITITNICKMTIQQKLCYGYTRRTNKTWWKRILLLQKHNQSNKSTIFYKELVNNVFVLNPYQLGLLSIPCRIESPPAMFHKFL